MKSNDGQIVGTAIVAAVWGAFMGFWITHMLVSPDWNYDKKIADKAVADYKDRLIGVECAKELGVRSPQTNGLCIVDGMIFVIPIPE